MHKLEVISTPESTDEALIFSDLVYGILIFTRWVPNRERELSAYVIKFHS